MNSTTRHTLTIGLVAATALALAACGLLGPSRGDDGRVTETSVIPSKTLLVGDCFTFVDGSDHAQSTVTPCSQDHAYIVIGQGDLSAAEISTAGSLQVAVSGACSDVFAQFKAAAAEGTKPEQEFIVNVETKDGVDTTHYSCVATDAVAA